jgi:N-acetylglucosaminyl-diphospho-decaprenol L-rhamnosyltransferase
MIREKNIVDVVIPTFNNWSLLQRGLQSLEQEGVIADVIVVDDVSSDETVACVRHYFPHVSVVELTQHRGLAYSLNRGAERGKAPYVLFLNDDVVAAPGAVRALSDVLRWYPRLAFAGGRLVDPDTEKTQDEYRPRKIPTAATLLVRLVGVERYWPSNPWSGQHVRAPLPEDEATIIAQQPAGACLMVRRSVLDSIGGWDERFAFWYEDVDLVARVLALRCGVWEPRAVFYHAGAHSTRAWQKPQQHAYLYNSTLRYAQAHLSKPSTAIIAAAAVLTCAVRVPYYLLRREVASARIYASLALAATRVLAGLDPGYAAVRDVTSRRSQL